MLHFAVSLLQWLPRVFLWLVVPITCVSALLLPARKSRGRAALGFIIAAAVSATFLAIETAAFGYICCDQARLLLSLLLDFRPGVTLGFALALVAGMAKPLIGAAPMVLSAIGTGAAALFLRRRPPHPDGLADNPSFAKEAGMSG